MSNYTILLEHAEELRTRLEEGDIEEAKDLAIDVHIRLMNAPKMVQNG